MHHPYAQDPALALAAAQGALTAVWCVLVRGQRHAWLGATAFGALAAAPWLGMPDWLAMLALMGLAGWWARSSELDASPRTPNVRQDLALFALGTLAGALVSQLVFARTSIMDDEWAYTFQADSFAHLRAYAPAIDCATPYGNTWLYAHEGRVFSQFTPGWPLFMAPFVRAGVAWLASPVCLGLLLVGVARIARRLHPDAGLVAALSAGAGASVLLNAGSRFSHVFVAALFAWSVEAACELLESSRGAFLLGSCVAWMVAARPADGLLLASGIALVLRTRGWRAWLVFAAWSAVTLIILRLQLGVWFQTGYALTETVQPWSTLHLLLPTWSEWTYALPLGVGAFCWWPCSPVLATAGLISVRRTPAAVMLAVGALALLAFYVWVDFARMRYWAYGPRYQLPLVVTFAVGGAVWVARARRDRLVVALIALGATVVIGRELYPPLQREAHARTALWRALQRDQLHHVVVWVGEGDVASHPSALAQNLSSEPEADVIVLVQRDRASDACARARYPDRAFYRALGRGEITLVRE